MSAKKPGSDPLFPHGAPPPHLIEAGVYPAPDPYWAPDEGWREQDGLILLPPLVSDGTTGEEWIVRLEVKRLRINDWAKYLLRSPDFRPTSGVTHRIFVLPGRLFSDNGCGRTSADVRSEAARRGLSAPNVEAGCLIRELLTNADLEAMGLWWILAMHEPIEDSDGDPYKLLVNHRGGGCCELGALSDWTGKSWIVEGGFAFVLEQTASSLES